MRVAITGGTGFLGRAVARAWVEAGAEDVRVVARSTHAELDALDVVQVRASVLDDRALAEAIEGSDVVYHLAGMVPGNVTLAMVFVNIVYFVLMLADARGLATLLAVMAGAIAGPLLHMATSDWGLLISGVIGGTLAFVVAHAWRSIEAKNV